MMIIGSAREMAAGRCLTWIPSGLFSPEIEGLLLRAEMAREAPMCLADECPGVGHRFCCNTERE
jgi:hypothetical protein